MSEQDTAGQPGPADYQQAAAAAGGAVPYEQAAAQAVGQVIDPEAAGENADAGASLAQMQQAQREALLPFEKRITDMMRQFEEQRDQMAKQIDQLQRQLATTQAQVGPAAVTLYADSAHQRAQSIAAANPDVDPVYFRQLTDATGALAAGARDVADGTAGPDMIGKLAGPVLDWIGGHAGKHLEGLGTLAHDLQHLRAETAKLAAAA